jgi:uridine kinase
VSVDGFHHSRAHRYQQGEDSARGYYEDAYDYQAVIDHVLGPLSKNVFPALCRPVARNLHSDMPDAAAPIAVGPDAVLLFDGIFLFRRELNAYWDFRILLDIDAAASISRAVDRDTGVIGPGDAARRRYEVRYEPAWQIYAREEHPELKADAIVDNRDFEHSRILKPAMGCWG